MRPTVEPWWKDAEEALICAAALYESRTHSTPLDTDAENAVNTLLHQRLTRMADWILRWSSEDDQLEVVQIVMVKLQRTEVLARVTKAASAAYFATMLRNASNDLHRQRRRLPTESLDETCAAFVDAISDDTLAVRQARQRMTADEQEILYYKFWMGMTFREIAGRLDITYSAAAKRFARAIEKLRDTLT